MVKQSESAVRVEISSVLGFCFGVRRAINILEKAAREHKNIYMLGPLVHNPQVVAGLARKGIKMVSNIDEIKEGAVVISSHGIRPEMLARMKARKLKIIDTTCPNVRRAQRAVKEFADRGYSVIIYGDAGHPEVKGLLGWGADNAVATPDWKYLKKRALTEHVGILAQTTQNYDKFLKFVKDVITLVLPAADEICVINSLCMETRKRLDAAEELAGNNDMIIVVGGMESANTRHLADTCAPLVETHHIETADQIKSAWLKGKHNIGVTAGASTPDQAIQEVVARLNSLVGKSNPAE